MSLNIKNEHVHDLVRTAAERTGLSQTSVVERAMTEMLRQLDADDEVRWARIDALIDDMAGRLQGADLSTDLLYDENGLPS